MHIFGNQTDVRIAVFAQGTAPTPAKLKKMFSCHAVKVYKGWGPYKYELDAIQSALAAKATLAGQTYQPTSYVEMAVMSAGASYTVFTVASRFESLIGTYRLDATLYQRLRMLTTVAARITWNLDLCNGFIRSVEKINQALTDAGVSDPIVQSFDPQAFLTQYGECGQAGFRAILELLAAEIPNLTWAADVPVYVPDPSDADADETQEQKAA